MATDTIGLEVLQKAKCFDCYATWHEAKMKGEMAASAAMLEAGYNLDCINPPYQGVNWRDKSQWPCAKTVRQHPQEESAALGHVQVCHPLVLRCCIAVEWARLCYLRSSRSICSLCDNQWDQQSFPVAVRLHQSSYPFLLLPSFCMLPPLCLCVTGHRNPLEELFVCYDTVSQAADSLQLIICILMAQQLQSQLECPHPVAAWHVHLFPCRIT